MSVQLTQSPTIDVTTLLKEKIDARSAYVDAADAYALKQQPVIDGLQDKITEFRAYSYALLQLVTPYSFAKPENLPFQDKGDLLSHLNRDVWPTAGLKVNIGSVDYWAASVTDPEFRKLVQARIAIGDRLNGTNNYDLLKLGQKEGQTLPDIKDAVTYDVLDSARGSIDSVFAGYTERYGNRDLGAYKRLNAQLAKRFRKLMGSADQVKVVAATQFFLNEFARLQSEIRDVRREMNEIGANNPALKDAHYEDLVSLAYLHAHGVEEVDAGAINKSHGLMHAADELETKLLGGGAQRMGVNDSKLPIQLMHDRYFGMVSGSAQQYMDKVVHGEFGAKRPAHMLVVPQDVVLPEDCGTQFEQNPEKVADYFSSFMRRATPMAQPMPH